MLIRSQNKLMSVSYETGLWLIVGGEIRYLSLNNTNYFMVFGEYSTEATAIKVLDMIQDTYTPSDGEVQAYIDGAIPKVVLDNRVFQMPQESEV